MLGRIPNMDDLARTLMMGRSGSAKLASEVVLGACEAQWTAGANVVCAAEGTLVRRGSYSAKCTLGAAITGVIGYQAVEAAAAAYDAAAAGITHVCGWIRSDTVLAAGMVWIGMDNAADFASEVGAGKEVIPVGAIESINTWYRVQLPIDADQLANLDSIDSVGLMGVAAPNTAVIYVDDIRLVRLVTAGEVDVGLVPIHAVQGSGGNVIDVLGFGLGMVRSASELPVDCEITPYRDTAAGWSAAAHEQGHQYRFAGEYIEPTTMVTAVAVERAADLAAGEILAVEVLQ